MALNTRKCDPMALKQLFFQKIRKIAQRLGAPPPDPRQQCVWITVHFFTQHVFQYKYFHILTIYLSPPLWTSSYLRANIRPWFLIFHSTISLPPQKIPLLKFLITSFACDLWFGPPPNQKSWLRLCIYLWETVVLQLLLLFSSYEKLVLLWFEQTFALLTHDWSLQY